MKSQGQLFLWLLPWLIVFGSIAAINLPEIKNWQVRQQSLITLQRAKESLLARAVSDLNRPGSFPCPDFSTDSDGLKNHPADGRSDMLVGSFCPSDTGWFPWVTLDQAELRDGAGSLLWFALDPNFRDDDSAPPINDRTPSTLTLDGRSDMVAILIAPGAPLIGQNRQKPYRISDYLEGKNALATGHFQQGSPESNDLLLGISRQELLSAVGLRVATSLQRCLHQHAALSAPSNLYPWPSPPGTTDGLARGGNYFGHLPRRSASQGLSQTLGQIQRENQLLIDENPLTGDPIKYLTKLKDHNEYLHDWLSKLYAVASDFYVDLGEFGRQINTSSLLNANSLQDGKLSLQEISQLQAQESLTQSSLQKTLGQLKTSGLDAAPALLNQLRLGLQNSITVESNLLQSAPLNDFLNHSYSTHPEIQQALAEVNAWNQSWLNELSSTHENTPEQQGMLEQVKAGLLSSLQRLQDVMSQHRNTLPASLLEDLAHSIGASGNTPPDRSELFDYLASTPAPAALSTEYDKLLAQLKSNASPNAEIQHQLFQLAEQASQPGDNLSTSSLTFWGKVRGESSSSIAPKDSSQGIAQIDALNRHLLYWQYQISQNMENLARLSRGAIGNAQVLDDSALGITQHLLDAIASAQTAQAKVRANPASTSLQAKASQALTEMSLWQSRQTEALARLKEILSGGAASALPIAWRGSACAFLRDSESWWFKNDWSPSLFYQIADIRFGGTGNLSVNGRGNYRLVTLSSGIALDGQQRRPEQLEDWLEAENADKSRSLGYAKPSTGFTAKTPSWKFNDRLAY